MTWLLRLAALVAVFFLLRWLWLWFWRSGWRRLFDYTLERARPRRAPSAHTGTVKRDPVCGTFVDVELSVQERIGERTLYFCSEHCRDAYRSRPSPETRRTG